MKFLMILIVAVFSLILQAEEIPLSYRGGVYHTQVTVNDILEMEFIVDSGAANVYLPQNVYERLRTEGSAGSYDIKGRGTSVIASGDTIDVLIINIKTLKIGQTEIQNVLASVGKGGTPLLGQSALKKLEPWSIDTQKNRLKFGAPKTYEKNFVSSSPGISRSEALDFVQYFISLQNGRNHKRLISLYAPEVDYLDQGMIAIQYVAARKEEFFNTWNKVEVNMIKLIETMDVPGRTGQKTVKYSIVSNLYSENKYRGKSEQETVTLVLQKTDGAIQIISEKVKRNKKY